VQKSKIANILLVTSLLCSSAAYAQANRLPGVVDKKSDKIKIPKGHGLKDKRSEPLKAKPALKKSSDEIVLKKLNNVIFSGNTVISSGELQAVVSPYIGKALSKESLAKMKYDVTSYFYDRGYILIRVVTPPQNIKNGVVNLKIHEASIGDIKITKNAKLNDRVINGITKRIALGTVFQEKESETVISDLNDIQNIQASINLQPGKEFKTTDINIILNEADEDTHNITFDTYGSELTGKRVATVHLEKGNMLGQGEVLSADLRKSDGSLWSVLFSAVTPTGVGNVNLETSYLHSENEIGDRLANLNAEGKSDIGNIALSSNFLNTIKYKSTGKFGLELRNHESRIGIPDATDTKDAIRQLYVDANFLQSSPESIYYVSGRLIKGVDILGASEDYRGTIANGSFASRAGGDPKAWIFRPTVLTNLKVAENGNFRFQATGQISSNKLLSSDLFVLGGYGSVRGYEPAFETGEEGFSFTAEYNHDFSVNADWSLSAGPFLDGGAVFNKANIGINDSHIYSVGLGAEFVTSSFNEENLTFRFDWAHPIGNYNDPAGIIDDDRFYFRLSQDF